MTPYKGLRGVLPDSEIRELVAHGAIAYTNPNNVGSSSLDTSLAGEAYRIPAIPLPAKDQTIRSLLSKVRSSPHDLRNPIEPGSSYLMLLSETLKLPQGVYGYASPKSTTGRLDIHVRLLVDGVQEYDKIPDGYEGELWLEVKPMSFPCQLHRNLSLNQLRFFTEDTRINTSAGLLEMQKEAGPFIFQPDGTPITLTELSGPKGILPLTICLDSPCIGYESIKRDAVLDLGAPKGTVDPADFFVPMRLSNGFLHLKKDHFYILSSNERVRVPVDYSCEMLPTDHRVGEMRVHFAGYIDDGWGGDTGDQLTLEVRPHEDIYLQPGQIIAMIVFEKMAKRADKPYTVKTSNYVAQSGPQLAKYFRK